MAKLQIKYYPEDVLRQKAKKIAHVDSSVRKLAQDLLDTMYENNGVGLAAPQVGVSKRMMVIDVSGEDEPRKPIVFINPEIVEREGELVGTEGCLSFPGVYFEVKRSDRVIVKYTNLSGKPMKMTAQGNLLCRAIQHEMDHLDGQLFIDVALNKLQADLEMTKHGFMGENVDISALAAEEGATISLAPEKQTLIG
jgi:peptide deformylase